MSLSGNKNTDFKILLDLPDVDFFKFCVKFKLDKDENKNDIIEYKNKYVNQFCKNETL